MCLNLNLFAYLGTGIGTVIGIGMDFDDFYRLPGTIFGTVLVGLQQVGALLVAGIGLLVGLIAARIAGGCRRHVAVFNQLLYNFVCAVTNCLNKC